MGYWIPPLIAAIANAILAASVARAAPGTRRSRAFALLTVALILWNLNFFVLFFVRDYESAFDLTRVLRMGAILIPSASLYFVAALRKRTSPLWKYAYSVNLLIGLGLVVANFLDLFVVRLRQFEFGYYSVAGPAYPLFVLYLSINCLIALAVLAYDYRTTDDARLRLELRFWFLGGAIALVLGTTNFFPAYGLPVYPLGNLGSTAWVAIVGYAFIRHRLMGVDVFISKGVALLLTAALVVAPAALLVFWMQYSVLGAINSDLSFVLLLSLVFVAVLFPFVQQRIEPGLHGSLFPTRVAPRIALTSFTRSVTRILDRDRLIRELASVLARNFRVPSVAIALTDASKSGFTLAYAVGPKSIIAEEDLTAVPLHQFIAQLAGPVVRAEMEHASGREKNEWLRDALQKYRWEVVVPFRVGPTLLGFLILGPKEELQSFSLQDLEILEELGAEAAIALDNARLYAEVQQSQAVLRRADRSSALGVLAAGIAHEIRNPLVTIQTFFQLAPDRLDDEEFVTSFLKTASGEVTRISKLINELLSFARSPSSELAPTDLNDVVQGALVLLTPEARKHGVRLEDCLDPLIPAVLGNYEQIRQVLINLIFNALQATSRGGKVTVSTRRVHVDGIDYGQIEVHDTGRGIPAADLENIYHPFFTTKASGTGLGLAIVQRILAEHDGRIFVASEEGKGTYFFVDFPIRQVKH